MSVTASPTRTSIAAQKPSIADSFAAPSPPNAACIAENWSLDW